VHTPIHNTIFLLLKFLCCIYYFGLEKQYYSFNEKNIHFLALSTETDFDDESEQYEFAKQDLEKYSKDPFLD
jgi:hypothetical protein